MRDGARRRSPGSPSQPGRERIEKSWEEVSGNSGVSVSERVATAAAVAEEEEGRDARRVATVGQRAFMTVVDLGILGI